MATQKTTCLHPEILFLRKAERDCWRTSIKRPGIRNAWPSFWVKEQFDAFLASGQAALPFDSMGNPWTGLNVFSSGNLKLDLLHNFFLECGTRANKIRVYEMCESATARVAVGYLLVRGALHIVAYAKALEKLTGCDVGELLPIPDVSNKKFPEAKALEDKGWHRIMFRWSQEDYTRLGEIWNGKHPEDESELLVTDEIPEGVPWPEFEEEPQLSAPGVDPDMLKYFADKLG